MFHLYVHNSTARKSQCRHLAKICYRYPSRHTFPPLCSPPPSSTLPHHSPFCLSLCPLMPLFPAILGECFVPPQRQQMGLKIIQRVTGREAENKGRLHSLFTSLGIGILMLKAIGQPFIKLTGDVGIVARG